MAFPTFGTNSVARKQRVYYEGISTIYEGMPVCYNMDATTNILGYCKGATAAVGTTTDEGYQNEGKFLLVENPALANMDWFAGVVATNECAGKIGPRWLDIYIPNGAIVPVRSALSTTTGLTVLAIVVGQQYLGNPLSSMPYFGSTASTTDARVVAIAEETVDRSSTNGLCLAKLCPDQFIHQGGQVGYELRVGAGTANATVNRMNIDFPQTGGHCQVLHYKGMISGAGSNARRGMYRFETFVTGSGASAQTEEVSCLNITTELDQTSTVTSGGGRFYGAHVTLRSRAFNPNLTSSIVATLALEYIMTKTTTSALDNPPSAGCLIYANCDEAGSVPGYFILCMGNSGKAIGYTANSSASAGGGSLKINISGIGDRYIMLSTSA